MYLLAMTSREKVAELMYSLGAFKGKGGVTLGDKRLKKLLGLDMSG